MHQDRKGSGIISILILYIFILPADHSTNKVVYMYIKKIQSQLGFWYVQESDKDGMVTLQKVCPLGYCILALIGWYHVLTPGLYEVNHAPLS